MSAEYRAKQAALVADHIKLQDIVITTALIPGRKAPVLVSEDMVKTMKPGSVIVDMAVEQGGNCPLSEYGRVVEKYGVKIVGPANLPGELATDASSLFSRNLLNFITPMVDKETKALTINLEDEVVKGTLVTRDGQIVHPLAGPAELKELPQWTTRSQAKPPSSRPRRRTWPPSSRPWRSRSPTPRRRRRPRSPTATCRSWRC